jgi:hypothetical protein
MHSLSNIGKILITLAGLVAVLDPIGADRLQRWAKSAQNRRKQAGDRSDDLTKARPWQAMVSRITMLVAIHDVSLRSPYNHARRTIEMEARDLKYVTGEEFKRFADEAWTAIRAAGKHNKAELESPRYMYSKFEPTAYEFLIKQLPEPQSTWLAFAYDEYKHRARRWWRIRFALLASVLPGTIALGWWFYAGGAPLWVSLFTAYIAVGMAALTANALLLTPRFVTALLWAEATVWLRLAWAGLWAMKDNGRWLRLTALAVFIVGSLLDLVGGWNA